MAIPFLVRRCYRCGGNLYLEREWDGDVIKCLQCGTEYDIPTEVKPEPVINWEDEKEDMPTGQSISDEDLEKQKEAMVTDCKILKQSDFLNKYHIGVARLIELKQKWGLEPKKKGGPRKSATCAETQTGHKRTLNVPENDGKSTKPVLPPWNEAWGDPVKVAWLQCVASK